MKFASTPGAVGPSTELWDLAVRCFRAWSSQDPDGMAACCEESGWQSINADTYDQQLSNGHSR
jgi:hypothetical protein